MRRRTLLALPAAARAGAPLQGRLAALRLGANLKRRHPVARDRQPRRLGPGGWRGFRDAGFDHARMVLPPPRETGDGEAVLGLWLQAVSDADGAGLPVLLGLADAYRQASPWQPRDWQGFAARAAFFGARTDPARVVLAPLNEPAFPDMAAWLPVRDRLLAALRRAAPGHILMWGGREWCSARSLVEAPPPADPGCVAEVHDDQAGDAAAVRARFAPVAAWAARHGAMVLASEVGAADAARTDPAAMARDLGRALPVVRALGLPVALWAYTHGGWWRLQAGDGPAPHPALRAVLA